MDIIHKVVRYARRRRKQAADISRHSWCGQLATQPGKHDGRPFVNDGPLLHSLAHFPRRIQCL